MIQSSVAIPHSIMSRASRVFTDIFNGLSGTELLLSDLVMVYNSITVPDIVFQGLRILSGLSAVKAAMLAIAGSGACHRRQRCFGFRRETARLRSTLNAKNQIILIIASGLVTIFPSFDQLKFYDFRSSHPRQSTARTGPRKLLNS
jgi:hypothetical protein